MTGPGVQTPPGPAIRLVEVGPRDGLQNESRIVPTEAKVAYINGLSRSGLTDIEVSSFVSPRWIPQLADADEVFRRIDRPSGVRYWALVPNERGLDRAEAARVDGIAVFTAASESFNRRNVNASISESLERFRPVVRRAKVPVRGYISVAFHCPFEGPIAPEAVARVGEQLLSLGCAELSVGDTLGRASAGDVRQLLEAVLPVCSADRLALHLHDTFGQAVGNALAGAEMGITVFDSSAGGAGGCPYAPGAPGNVATEALVRAFDGRTGVDLPLLSEAIEVIRPHLTPRSA